MLIKATFCTYNVCHVEDRSGGIQVKIYLLIQCFVTSHNNVHSTGEKENFS